MSNRNIIYNIMRILYIEADVAQRHSVTVNAGSGFDSHLKGRFFCLALLRGRGKNGKQSVST